MFKKSSKEAPTEAYIVEKRTNGTSTPIYSCDESRSTWCIITFICHPRLVLDSFTCVLKQDKRIKCMSTKWIYLFLLPKNEIDAFTVFSFFF